MTKDFFDIDKAIRSVTNSFMNTRYMNKRGITALLAASMLVMTGCSKQPSQNTQVPSTDVANSVQSMEQKKDDVTKDGIKNDAVIMVVGDAKITYSEIVVYMLMLKQQYEPVFTDGIWDFSVNSEENFEDMAKDEIINQIARLKIMGFKASSLEVSLNSEEKLDIEDDAVEFLQNISMEDQKKYGINQELVETIYKDNYLAQKVFDVVVSDVDTNVSDEEAIAARVKQIKVIFNGTNRKGEVLTGEQEDKDKAKKEADIMQDALANKGKEFDFYCDKYSDAANEEIRIMKGGDTEPALEVALSMENNTYSDVIEGEDAYYILYCIDSADNSMLEENKKVIVKRRQDECFGELYEKWIGQYDTYIVTDLWNMISIADL